ncbi:hypothetical protein PAPYR_11443 [Paratrimastix pyriformis]|uniref:Uncharacterized protein n=1 Tax=Paratrimastix pyriformis TaxID=342808 RepID=A0ABQ8U3S6_9EUKA|nr:hypothetical protein PAPYR_11443 [Paratrimastix pyriformis]
MNPLHPCLPRSITSTYNSVLPEIRPPELECPRFKHRNLPDHCVDLFHCDRLADNIQPAPDSISVRHSRADPLPLVHILGSQMPRARYPHFLSQIHQILLQTPYPPLLFLEPLSRAALICGHTKIMCLKESFIPHRGISSPSFFLLVFQLSLVCSYFRPHILRHEPLRHCRIISPQVGQPNQPLSILIHIPGAPLYQHHGILRLCLGTTHPQLHLPLLYKLFIARLHPPAISFQPDTRLHLGQCHHWLLRSLFASLSAIPFPIASQFFGSPSLGALHP